MPKSIVEKVIYTPSAYQPYDFMRCFNLAVSVAFGGGSKGEPGERGGEELLRGVYDLKPADEGPVRRIGWLRDVGSIVGVVDLHEGRNLRSIRGTRCIVFRLARRRCGRTSCSLLSSRTTRRRPKSQTTA